MAMMRLRTFLADAHARALAATGILDREVADPLLEERLIRIRAQITASLAIREMLTEMEIDLPATLDLRTMIHICHLIGIFGRREASSRRAPRPCVQEDPAAERLQAPLPGNPRISRAS